MATKAVESAPDTKTETTEAPAMTEPKGTLIPVDSNTDWGRETRIVESKVVAEDGQTVGTKDEAVATDEAKPAETEAKDDATTVTSVEPPTAVEQPVTVPDPGEYKPKDYSFEVTIYDAEGKKGKTQKVTSVEQWDQLLDTDPNFGSATALLKAQRASTRMETSLERDQADYDVKKTEFDQATEAQAAATQQVENISKEINYLVGRGELPKVAAEYVNADWSDPGVAKQPGVKEQIALLDYMSKENTAREKAGLAPMTSILDAWNSFQLGEAKKASSARQTEAAEARKEAGARVAGVSLNPTVSAPKGIAVGRGGSLSDLGATDWSV